MPKRDAPTRDCTEPEPGHGFYGRWSRRKRLARAGGDPDPGAPPCAPERAPRGDEAERPTQPTAQLTDDDMPALESLDQDADFSGFLSPGVSEELRTLALRKLFSSPKFNVVDGLDDYAEDFTRFDPLGDIVTADMRHQLEVAEARRREALADARGAGADAATVDSPPAAEPSSPASHEHAAEPAADGPLETVHDATGREPAPPAVAGASPAPDREPDGDADGEASERRNGGAAERG